MEGNRGSFLKKRPNPQFKEKGGYKKGKWNKSNHEESSEDFHASDTVYRILCHSRKIGSVIGKGGSIVKALREETQSKIKVADSVPGSDERVIIIYSPSTMIRRKDNTDNSDEDLATEKEYDLMEPHCAAQDALLKVHDRIIEEDLFGGTENEDDNDNVVTARLLVPNNMVGCLLGKKGDVIQRLRSETGASIRVLPAEHLPACAMSTDELVQIAAKSAVAKRALYEVSTLLHQNPRKNEPPSSFLMPYGGQGFHPPGPPMENMFPRGNPTWSQRNPYSHVGGHRNEISGFGPGGFNGVPVAHGGESPSEFFMKILCSAAKIGGVIGKGGCNIKQVEQETGANIHVDDVAAESEERVIRVSSFEALWNPESQTIDAILQLQNKTSELSGKGIIITRLLVPSSKAGCILGHGGSIINEMRKRTHADIRVYSQEEKPECAAKDEELVQISGNFDVAKDALAEISSRLRVRCLRDAKPGAEPAPISPVSRFGHLGKLPGRGQPPSGTIGAGSYRGYEYLKGGGYDYKPPNYLVPPSSSRYPDVNSPVDVKIPNIAMGSVMGTGGSNAGDIPGTSMKLQDPLFGGSSEYGVEFRGYSQHMIPGTRMKLQDPDSGGSEYGAEFRGYSQHLSMSQSIPPAFTDSGGRNSNCQLGSYHSFNSQQGADTNFNASQTPYHNSKEPHQAPSYQNTGSQHATHYILGGQRSYQY